MASTVIVGSGVIGVSTAYYLSKHQPGSTIHLVDASPELFSSASGYAGGFLAKDWFPPALTPLGELSYEEHRKLADDEGGRDKWAYAKSVTVSYYPEGRKPDGRRGEDWLLSGTSRAGLVQNRNEVRDGDVPPWLRRVAGDEVTVVDGGEGTALLDPLRLCQYLLDKCRAAGVHVYNPATVASLGRDTDGRFSHVRIRRNNSSKETEIPATRLLIATGAWTPQVLSSLFPKSSAKVELMNLAGHSLVFRNPTTASHVHHSLYCSLDSWAPELYARPNGDVYIAGVNSTTIPLPPPDRKPTLQKEALEILKETTKKFIGADAELNVVRTGLCFRPVSTRGTPYIGRLEDELLGGGIATRSGSEGGVFVAAGHGPWGISLGLGTGRVMAEMMQGREVSVDVSALGIEGQGIKAKL